MALVVQSEETSVESTGYSGRPSIRKTHRTFKWAKDLSLTKEEWRIEDAGNKFGNSY